MKEIIFTLILALSIAHPLSAATAATGFLQSVSAQSGSASSIVTAATTTTSGNLFVVFANAGANNFGATPISDSKSNTWVQAIAPFGTSFGFSTAYYCTSSCTGGASHTFTFTPSSSTTISVTFVEISGQTTSPLGSSNTSSSSTGSHNSGNITSGSGGPEIFLGYMSISHGNETTAVISGSTWALITFLPDGTPQGCVVAFRLAPPSTTDSFAVTSSVNNEAILIQSFKLNPASGGSGFFIPHD